MPKKSNNIFNTSKSNDLVSRFEGSLHQSRIVRRGEKGLGFENSLSQSGIMRRGGRGLISGNLRTDPLGEKGREDER